MLHNYNQDSKEKKSVWLTLLNIFEEERVEIHKVMLTITKA